MDITVVGGGKRIGRGAGLVALLLATAALAAGTEMARPAPAVAFQTACTDPFCDGASGGDDPFCLDYGDCPAPPSDQGQGPSNGWTGDPCIDNGDCEGLPADGSFPGGDNGPYSDGPGDPCNDYGDCPGGLPLPDTSAFCLDYGDCPDAPPPTNPCPNGDCEGGSYEEGQGRVPFVPEDQARTAVRPGAVAHRGRARSPHRHRRTSASRN